MFNDTVLSNNTLIYEKTLNINIDGKNTEQLNRALDEAKIELETLKQDHIVIANNRTVKRLLDHVKIEGTQNLSHQVKRDIQPGDQDGIGVIVTKYQDELHEKTRENAEVTARLVKFERELYEKSCIHNELKIKVCFEMANRFYSEVIDQSVGRRESASQTNLHWTSCGAA